MSWWLIHNYLTSLSPCNEEFSEISDSYLDWHSVDGRFPGFGGVPGWRLPLLQAPPVFLSVRYNVRSTRRVGSSGFPTLRTSVPGLCSQRDHGLRAQLEGASFPNPYRHSCLRRMGHVQDLWLASEEPR